MNSWSAVNEYIFRAFEAMFRFAIVLALLSCLIEAIIYLLFILVSYTEEHVLCHVVMIFQESHYKKIYAHIDYFNCNN